MSQTRSGNVFTVTVTTKTNPQAFCGQMLTPFEQVISLEVGSLLPGMYVVRVNGVRAAMAVPAPDSFAALTFDEGDFVAPLSAGRVPRRDSLRDATGRASGVLWWGIDLPAGAEREVDVVVPFGEVTAGPGGQAALLPGGFDAGMVAGWQT